MNDPLERIAAALERLAPAAVQAPDWRAQPAYVWDGSSARGIARIEAPAIGQLIGIDRQKVLVAENVARLAQGAAAHDMLLWGARGMGKSALVRSATAAAQAAGGSLALVQVSADALASLPELFALLSREERNFLVYLDDLGFAEGGLIGPRQLRSWLEGGVEARPANVRLAVTSNRRAIVTRRGAEQDTESGHGPLNPRDALDDLQALADRFGLAIGFHNASQEEYLAIVASYADPLNLTWERAEALEWAQRRGARSGRTAWQFVTELAGRAGRRL